MVGPAHFLSKPNSTRILLSSPPFPTSGRVAGAPSSSVNGCVAETVSGDLEGTEKVKEPKERDEVEGRGRGHADHVGAKEGSDEGCIGGLEGGESRKA